ncbi:hemocyte defensin Cg-Defh2-like [Saccostrea cucullata]|uniref:hemocyte defensin Cg-Defh2-like n=1 Tax=Saccostrea cuccullata TaxID=36930 RepID=UPI002ED522CD
MRVIVFIGLCLCLIASSHIAMAGHGCNGPWHGDDKACASYCQHTNHCRGGYCPAERLWLVCWCVGCRKTNTKNGS